jgi:3D (Asp-Asp-Asp) domain-containing protein
VQNSPIIEAETETYDSFEQLPLAGEREAKKSFYLTVTAYSSTVDQCDGDPFTTASGETVHDGIIAYNHLPFGTKVRFPEIFPGKVFEVQDRLRAGAGIYHADIWMGSREEAIQWGARVIKIEVL